LCDLSNIKAVSYGGEPFKSQYVVTLLSNPFISFDLLNPTIVLNNLYLWYMRDAKRN